MSKGNGSHGPIETENHVHTTPLATVLRVFHVKEGEVVYVRTLADNYGGMFTHYCPGGSQSCEGRDCPPLRHKHKRTWKGYTPVEIWDKAKKVWCPFVLEITESLELDFRDRFQRGQVWQIFRHLPQGKKKMPVEGKLTEERNPAEFPPAFNIMPPLLHMYRGSPVDLSTPNPLPPRVFMKASAGAAPAQIAEEEQQDRPCTPEEYEAIKKKYNDMKKPPTKVMNGRH